MFLCLRWALPGALLATSASLDSQPKPTDCVPLPTLVANAAQPLVRSIRVSDDNSTVVDVRGSGNSDLGGFLRKGGSIVLIDDQGKNIGVVNRDSLDSSALSSKAELIKVSPRQTGAADHAFEMSARPESLRKIGELPENWPFRTLPDHPLQGIDLDNLQPDKKHSPDGMAIGDFDGVVAPTVVIGDFNGAPLQPRSAPPQPPAKAVAATVAIYYRNRNDASYIGLCNGIQIAPGLILTNLHCASKDNVDHVVHFGALHLRPDDLLPGSPVSGDVRCRASPVSPFPDQHSRLDFAVLKISATIPEPFASAIAEIDDGSLLNEETTAVQPDFRAVQIQYWLAAAAGAGGRQYQKFLMRPPNCAIKRDAGLTPRKSYFCNSNELVPADLIDPSGVGHTCDSDHGSSGSPLFDQNLDRLVALHRGGGEDINVQNCAIPASRIRAQLVSWGYLASR